MFDLVFTHLGGKVVSAITGIYYRDSQSVDRVDLGRMVEILAHRGPDRVGIWSEGAIGLGHRLLWTTPESLLEHLPLVNQTGDLILTADARIDNRDELIAALGLMDRPAEKIADSQLILSAYEKWGDRCPEQLLGDFAFAIWDGRRQVLFCARDHMGVKPFYYYASGRAFIFATEIKALLCLPEVPRQLNEVKVANYLAAILHDNNSTFYKSILRLPPGHSLTISPTGKRLQTYWSLDPSRELQMTDAESAEAFREIFTKAVGCRLRSAFSIGSHLSGGLDSSSITCTARKILTAEGRSQLHTFSAIFDKVTQCDERSFQNAVLAQGNLEPHYLQADHMSPLTDLDRLLWHQDEVFLPANQYFDWGMYGLANQLGIRVVLDGFDGDTTVSHGNEYLRELARRGQWLTLATETKAYGKRFNLPWRKVLGQWIWLYGIRPTLSGFPVIKSVKLRQPADNPMWDIPFNPDFVQRLDLVARFQAKVLDSPQTERENHHRSLTNDVITHCLECLDRSAAAFSIETRFPFCDKRLVEICLALPPNQKLHQGWNRIVMRRAMDGILPPQIQWRANKANFAPSLEQGLQAYERERLEKVVLKDPGVIEEYVDVSALRQAYHRLVSQKATENDVNTLWRTALLAVWLQSTGLAA